jgi:hypothetical protein
VSCAATVSVSGRMGNKPRKKGAAIRVERRQIATPDD